jgi:DNA-binding Lrp family transcriptional regulator
LIASEDGAIARAVNRISWNYVLRASHQLTEVFGDIRSGFVAQAIHTANTAHITVRTSLNRPVTGHAGILSDGVRKPVGISALSESLGLPFESIHRIVRRLIEQGACEWGEGGVIVPAALVEGPEAARSLTAHLGHVRSFVRDLQALDLAEPFTLALTPATEETDAILGRIIGRPSGDYLVRALKILADSYGDIRTGIVIQTIVTANTDHLDTESHRGPRYAAIDDPAPDNVRRPISIARLADSLGFSYEAIRSQVKRLIEKGLCQRVDGGLIVPQAVVEQPATVRVMLENVGYVRRFLRELAMLVLGMEPDEHAIPEHDRLVRERHLVRIITGFEQEEDPAARDRLRRLLIEEEDRYGSLTQRLELADYLIARGEERVRRAERELRRSAPLLADSIRRRERTLANMRSIVAITKDYRRTLIDALARGGI